MHTNNKEENTQTIKKLRNSEVTFADTFISTEASASPKKRRRTKSRRKKSKKGKMAKSKSTILSTPNFDTLDFEVRSTEIELETMKTVPLSLAIPDPALIDNNEFHMDLFREAHSNCNQMLEYMRDDELWKLSKNKKGVQLYKMRAKLKPSE